MERCQMGLRRKEAMRHSCVVLVILLVSTALYAQHKRVKPLVAAGQYLAWSGTAWGPLTPPAQPTGGSVAAAGTITITNAAAGSYTFKAAVTNALCTASPNFDPATLPGLTWWVTDTNTAITVHLSAAGSGTFVFVCTTPTN